MLKWRRCGGSHPEGLDRIDSSTRTQTHRTFSLRESSNSSPRAINRRKNDLFTRSFCAGDNKKPPQLSRSISENDIQSFKHKNLRTLITEHGRVGSPVNPSPFENINLEDIYKNFDKAHAEFSVSPVTSPEDNGCHEIFVVAPSKSRQNSRHEKQCSPTSLPCIEEAVENDELASIADSGICDDEEYEIDSKLSKAAKHYFEPLKFHDGSGEHHLLNSINSELLRRHSPCSPDHNKMCSSPLDHKIMNSNDQIETDYKNKMHHNFEMGSSDESELTSSQESDSSNIFANFEDINDESNKTNNNNGTLSDIDTKNSQIFSRLKLKADLTGGMQSPDSVVPHSLISSMLWNGNTSDQPPSSTGIYSTMPPSRYGQRNKDFMSQLSSSQEKSPCPKEFKVSLDVSHYGPDEILATLEDGKLVVNGKHFSESEYGFESLQFHRRYPIPEGIKKDDIKSTITDDGILIITGRVAESPEMKLRNDSRMSQYDNVDSPRLRRGTSSGRSTPVGRTTPEILSSGEHVKIPSPTFSRRSFSTSDYSEDSRSRLSEDSNISENEFQETEEDTFLLKVNCKGYDPQDLELKIQSRELIIHGRQKICSVENGHERIRHKEFTKRYSVPRNANCHQIMSKFTEDEQLVVQIRKGGSHSNTIIREDILDDA